jgi:hypothetical protein
LKPLPATKRCASGHAAESVDVPANPTTVPVTYQFALRVKLPRGRTLTRRVNVLEAPLTIAPAITTQPVGATVLYGQTVTLTAAASGSPTPSVQWQVSPNGGAAWENLPGATLSTYTFVVADGQAGSLAGDEYRAVFTNVAGSAASAAATFLISPAETPNMAGYFAYAPAGETFSAASASWIVPTVDCTGDPNSWAVQWPGVGSDTSVVQDGTQEGCMGGTPEYFAWYELVGDSAVNSGNSVPLSTSSYPVHPGDAISASVSIANSTWTLTVTNHTEPWVFTFTTPNTSPGLDQSSAQVVVEGPPLTDSAHTLANFTPVSFTASTATLYGQSGPIGSFFPIILNMVNGSTPRANVGPLDASGDFTDSWASN